MPCGPPPIGKEILTFIKEHKRTKDDIVKYLIEGEFIEPNECEPMIPRLLSGYVKDGFIKPVENRYEILPCGESVLNGTYKSKC